VAACGGAFGVGALGGGAAAGGLASDGVAAATGCGAGGAAACSAGLGAAALGGGTAAIALASVFDGLAGVPPLVACWGNDWYEFGSGAGRGRSTIRCSLGEVLHP